MSVVYLTSTVLLLHCVSGNCLLLLFTLVLILFPSRSSRGTTVATIDYSSLQLCKCVVYVWMFCLSKCMQFSVWRTLKSRMRVCESP